ncbi:MAG TPA: hypothetical protein VF043_33790 [Ktedonobacteraceae bacterium]
MQELRMRARASQPRGDGGLSKTEDPFGGGRIEPFGQRRQDHGDLVRGSFQTVQGGVTPGGKGGAAGLTPKRLDVLSTAMLAIAHQRMNVRIGVPEVPALPVRTSEPFGIDAFRCSSATFHFRPGTHSSRRWLHTRRGSGSQATGGAIVWAARLQETLECAALGPSSRGERLKAEPVEMPQQREEKADHEQEHVDVKGHNDPRFSEWGEGSTLREARIRRGSQAVKPLGEMSELSTTTNGCTPGCLCAIEE